MQGLIVWTDFRLYNYQNCTCNIFTRHPRFTECELQCLTHCKPVFYFYTYWTCTAQKMKFSIKDFFGKCDQIRNFLRIWSHLLKKSLMKNFIFCAVMSKKRGFMTCSGGRKGTLAWNELISRNDLNVVYVQLWYYLFCLSLHRKWSFPLSISSVNVTRSAVSILVTKMKRIVDYIY